MTGCYLLHFSSPVRGKLHYIGFSTNIPARFQKHLSGEGSELTGEAVRSGVPFELVRVWPDVKPEFEQKLKRNKNMKRYCIKCQEAADSLSRRTAG